MARIPQMTHKKRKPRSEISVFKSPYRTYHNRLLDLWFCPECDFADEDKMEVLKHCTEVHSAIGSKGVIL